MPAPEVRICLNFAAPVPALPGKGRPLLLMQPYRKIQDWPCACSRLMHRFRQYAQRRPHCPCPPRTAAPAPACRPPDPEPRRNLPRMRPPKPPRIRRAAFPRPVRLRKFRLRKLRPRKFLPPELSGTRCPPQPLSSPPLPAFSSVPVSCIASVIFLPRDQNMLRPAENRDSLQRNLPDFPPPPPGPRRLILCRRPADLSPGPRASHVRPSRPHRVRPSIRCRRVFLPRPRVEPA